MVSNPSLRPGLQALPPPHPVLMTPSPRLTHAVQSFALILKKCIVAQSPKIPRRGLRLQMEEAPPAPPPPPKSPRGGCADFVLSPARTQSNCKLTLHKLFSNIFLVERRLRLQIGGLRPPPTPSRVRLPLHPPLLFSARHARTCPKTLVKPLFWWKVICCPVNRSAGRAAPSLDPPEIPLSNLFQNLWRAATQISKFSDSV